MAKICPPGFICIENMTIIFLILVLILAVVVYYYIINKQPTSNKEVVVIKENNNSSFFPKMNSIFSMDTRNTLMNPFTSIEGWSFSSAKYGRSPWNSNKYKYPWV